MIQRDAARQANASIITCGRPCGESGDVSKLFATVDHSGDWVRWVDAERVAHSRIRGLEPFENLTSQWLVGDRLEEHDEVGSTYFAESALHLLLPAPADKPVPKLTVVGRALQC